MANITQLVLCGSSLEGFYSWPEKKNMSQIQEGCKEKENTPRSKAGWKCVPGHGDTSKVSAYPHRYPEALPHNISMLINLLWPACCQTAPVTELITQMGQSGP